MSKQKEQELSTRTLDVRADTVNEDDRSVEATLSTDMPVEVFDWRLNEVVEEVLTADGLDIPRQLPLLDSHERYSTRSVLGSIRDIKSERRDSDGVKRLVGRLYFAEADENAERVWNLVRQKHLTDVSVGYRVLHAVEIPRGEKRSIGGREYEAKNRRLRVATKWVVREASVVAIGADPAAKTREDNLPDKELDMTTESKERKEDAGVDQREVHSGDTTAAIEQARQQAREEARQEELQRTNGITVLYGPDISEELYRKAITDGWSVERAQAEFLKHIRESRKPKEDDDTPRFSVHSRSKDAMLNARTLAASQLLANGLDPMKVREHNGNRPTGERFTEQECDYGDEFANMSSADLVRECLRLDTGRYIRDPEEAWRESRQLWVRAGMSGTSLSNVFTTNLYAMLVAGWNEAVDTTGWCDETEVANFLSHEDITLDANMTPDRHPRGATAKHATMTDRKETYQAYRFSKKFVVDEMDIIDDRLGALMTAPREMGDAFRRLRQDMVYSLLLKNPTLNATSGALFNATAETTAGGHANLTTAALASAGLKAAITDMAQKRIDNKVLNIRPQYLIVPPDLDFTADELINSSQVLIAGNTDQERGNRNTLQGRGLMKVTDARLDATGCTDPITGTAYTGSATNWFLAAPRNTVAVVYRRGAGRAPQLTTSTDLDLGQWGMGWAMKLDIGVFARDFRGLHKSTGAG